MSDEYDKEGQKRLHEIINDRLNDHWSKIEELEKKSEKAGEERLDNYELIKGSNELCSELRNDLDIVMGEQAKDREQIAELKEAGSASARESLDRQTVLQEILLEKPLTQHTRNKLLEKLDSGGEKEKSKGRKFFEQHNPLLSKTVDYGKTVEGKDYIINGGINEKLPEPKTEPEKKGELKWYCVGRHYLNEGGECHYCDYKKPKAEPVGVKEVEDFYFDHDVAKRVRDATRKELIEEFQDDLDSLNKVPGIPYSFEPLNKLKEKWQGRLEK